MTEDQRQIVILKALVETQTIIIEAQKQLIATQKIVLDAAMERLRLQDLRPETKKPILRLVE